MPGSPAASPHASTSMMHLDLQKATFDGSIVLAIPPKHG
jgi:hypothetical protein